MHTQKLKKLFLDLLVFAPPPHLNPLWPHLSSPLPALPGSGTLIDGVIPVKSHQTEDLRDATQVSRSYQRLPQVTPQSGIGSVPSAPTPDAEQVGLIQASGSSHSRTSKTHQKPCRSARRSPALTLSATSPGVPDPGPQRRYTVWSRSTLIRPATPFLCPLSLVWIGSASFPGDQPLSEIIALTARRRLDQQLC